MKESGPGGAFPQPHLRSTTGHDIDQWKNEPLEKKNMVQLVANGKIGKMSSFEVQLSELPKRKMKRKNNCSVAK